MSRDLSNLRLPWQMIVLGFGIFGGIFAGMFFVWSFMPSMELGSLNRGARLYGGTYLLGLFIAAPLLIRSGLRRIRKWKDEENLPGEIDPSQDPRGVPVVFGPADADPGLAPLPPESLPRKPRRSAYVYASPEKGVAVSIVALIAGIGVSVSSYYQAPWTSDHHYSIYWGLIVMGAAGIVINLFRKGRT